MSEYNNSQVGSRGCSYASLGRYNQGTVMAPVPVSSSPGGNMVVVPSYGSNGYPSLTHGAKEQSCSGFFKVKDAYPNSDGNCVQNYMSRSCS